MFCHEAYVVLVDATRVLTLVRLLGILLPEQIDAPSLVMAILKRTSLKLQRTLTKQQRYGSAILYSCS